LADRTFRDDLALAALPLVWEARQRSAAALYLSDEEIRREAASDAYAFADFMLAARVNAIERELASSELTA
jgi:hypothetical protein